MRNLFTRQIFVPLFWWIKKMPVLDVFQSFSKKQFDPIEKFTQRQNEMIKALVRHAAEKSAFYTKIITKDILKAIEDDPPCGLRQIPVLTKEDLRKHRNEMIIEMGRRTFLNSSGGSTGRPVDVCQDSEYQTNALATTHLMYRWAGKRLGDSHVKLWGAERDLLKGAMGGKQILLDFLDNRITLNAFKLSPDRMHEYIKKINAFKPVCLEGYAESLFEFARFIEREMLNIYSPRAIVSSAGTLFPEMRKKIQEVFRSEIFDRYGSRETGNMAAECECHEGLHIFGETTLIEVVNAKGSPVEPGEEGDVLVTNLINYTMPLIRYQIGDRAVKSNRYCSCGRPYPLLEKISGRVGSTFYTLNGGVVSPEFFIHLIGVMHNDGRVGVFQVVQELLDYLVVKVVPNSGSNLNNWPARRLIERDIKSVMGEGCRVKFSQEKSIEPTPTGKHIYTINNIGIGK